jgi:hypothetical protein
MKLVSKGINKNNRASNINSLELFFNAIDILKAPDIKKTEFINLLKDIVGSFITKFNGQHLEIDDEMVIRLRDLDKHFLIEYIARGEK